MCQLWSTWLQEKSSKCTNLGTSEYIPAVVQLTQRNIFHTHLPLSLEKLSDLSFAYESGGVKEGNQEYGLREKQDYGPQVIS